MTIGSFTLIKNEILWIEKHLQAWLPILDEMVFFDGNSTDGTREIIEKYSNRNKNIRLVINKDPKNLQDDYERLFNDCLHSLTTDYAIFLHPDMFPDGEQNLKLGNLFAYSSGMRAFAGDPGGQTFEVVGRESLRWKHIYRMRNPDLGLHYFGHYGAWNEDCYFSAITGDSHIYHGDRFSGYPYEVGDSGLKILHFSDVRPYERRFQRMLACLKNQKKKGDLEEMARNHQRVCFRNNGVMKFVPVQDEQILKHLGDTKCQPSPR